MYMSENAELVYEWLVNLPDTEMRELAVELADRGYAEGLKG